jgi:hypothetical protein
MTEIAVVAPEARPRTVSIMSCRVELAPQASSSNETGRSSWTAPLDAVRLAPGEDAATVTATQLRDVVARLIAAGHWSAGDPDILIVADAGYDAPRLAWLMRDLPVQVLARMRSDRVLRRAVPPRAAGTNGRPPRHGGEFIFGDPDSWQRPDVTTMTETRLYGQAVARSWDRLHPRLIRRAGRMGSADLPLIEGSVIRLDVARLPSGAIPKPVWLWWSGTGATPGQVDLLWQAFLRRFDIEHTFRLFKQTLGWTCPKVRTPEAADRWTWMIIAVHAQLRLARGLAADLRRPWEQITVPERLSPARVRRGFRHLRGKTPCPASASKPCQPGPGRPPGRRNTKPTPRYDVPHRHDTHQHENQHQEPAEEEIRHSPPPEDRQVRVCQTNGVTHAVEVYLRPAERRPSKVISKAFNAGFQRMTQRRRPCPVGSRLITAR